MHLTLLLPTILTHTLDYFWDESGQELYLLWITHLTLTLQSSYSRSLSIIMPSLFSAWMLPASPQTCAAKHHNVTCNFALYSNASNLQEHQKLAPAVEFTGNAVCYCDNKYVWGIRRLTTHRLSVPLWPAVLWSFFYL